MSARGAAKERGRPREQGEAKERSSRLRARAAADYAAQRVNFNGAEAARPRAIGAADTAVLPFAESMRRPQ